MFEITLLSLRVRFSIATNRLLFFVKRIPGLKRAISPNVYGDYALKDALTVLGVIFVASKKAMLHLLYMVIVVVIGAFVNQVHLSGGLFRFFESSSSFDGMTAAGVVNYALYAWFIISCVFSPACSVSAEMYNLKNDEMMLNYFRASPNVYARSRIIVDRIAHILLVTPFLVVAFLIAGLPLWRVLTTLIMLTCYRLAGEVIQLAMFKNFRVHFARPWLNNTASFAMLAAAVLIPISINITDMAVGISHPVVALLFIPVGILSWNFLRDYKLYKKLHTEKNTWYTNQLNKYEAQRNAGGAAGSTMDFTDAKKWSRDVNTDDLEAEKDKHKNVKGFAYLNAVFFDRHSKFFRKKLIRRSVFFLLVPILMLWSAIYIVYISGYTDIGWSNLYNIEMNGVYTFIPGLFLEPGFEGVFNLAPIFFFIIYIVSMGRVVTASVFTNCDIHMLHYRYYRTRDTILASFKARLKVILRYNFIITTVIYISMISAIAIIYGRMDFKYAAVSFALLTVIGVFFAFNDLFLYYVIQPYDSAGKGKSIIYSIINYAIYFIAWMNFYIRLDFFLYSLVIVAATFVYFGVGTVLLLKLAPKRFKLR